MKRTHIMLHHSLTKDSLTVSWPVIREYHMTTLHFRDIGYHWGLELVAWGNGRRSLEILLGRPETDRAAACPQGDMNELAYHICVVGNFDLDAPSPAQYAKLAQLIKPLMHRSGIGVDGIVGHRDFNLAKTCPGTLFDLGRLRGML